MTSSLHGLTIFKEFIDAKMAADSSQNLQSTLVPLNIALAIFLSNVLKHYIHNGILVNYEK